MKKRPGFTLAELVIAVLIFGFMSTSMATIYSTANRHMFQNYRNNTIKSNVSLAMRDIRRNLQMATRIDSPAYGAGGSVLAFAVNVDQLTGCYPINPPAAAVAAPAGAPATWHYFCTKADPGAPGTFMLYHHTGAIPGDDSWCGNAPTNIWAGLGSYPVPICGQGMAGQTVTLLMQYSVAAAAPNSSDMFSRKVVDRVNERDAVLVTLRSQWVAAARLNSPRPTQRDVDFTLASQIKIIAPNQ